MSESERQAAEDVRCLLSLKTHDDVIAEVNGMKVPELKAIADHLRLGPAADKKSLQGMVSDRLIEMRKAGELHRLRDEAYDSDATALRTMIGAAAERQPMPARFTATRSVDTPTVWVRDGETGRETQVPLFAYAAVRKALQDLFGDQFAEGE